MHTLAPLALCSLLTAQAPVTGGDAPAIAASQPDAVAPSADAPAQPAPTPADAPMFPLPWLWLPALSGAGCALCAGPPACLVTSSVAFIAFGAALTQCMPCFGVMATISAALFTAFFGVVPGLIVGPCGAVGAVGGGLIGALIGNQSLVNALIGALPALLLTAASAGAGVTALALWFSQPHPTFNNADPKTYPPVIALVASAALGLAVGPVALLGMSGYTLWQGAE